LLGEKHTALVAPEHFGIATKTHVNLDTPLSPGSDPPVNPKNRRVLIFVAKVLQNIANGPVMFGGKEPYMKPMNKFITENAPSVRRLCERLGQPVDDPNLVMSEPISGLGGGDLSDITCIHRYVSLHRDKIAAELDGNALVSQFRAVLKSAAAVLDQQSNRRTMAVPDAGVFEGVRNHGVSNEVLDRAGGVVRIARESVFDLHWREQEKLIAQFGFGAAEHGDILNNGQVSPTAVKPEDACAFVHSLLSELLQLYARNEGKWSTIRGLDEFKAFESRCSIMGSPEFSLYMNDVGLLTFWINVFNLMVCGGCCVLFDYASLKSNSLLHKGSPHSRCDGSSTEHFPAALLFPRLQVPDRKPRLQSARHSGGCSARKREDEGKVHESCALRPRR
jgi:hypothetical protein